MNRKTEFCNPHNIRRREKHKNQKIASQAEYIRMLEKENKKQETKTQKKSKSMISYYKKKCDKLSEAKSELTAESEYDNTDEYFELEMKLAETQTKYQSLLDENASLHEKINEIENKTIKLFEDGKYNEKTRECVMELLSLNVSITKIEEVIRSVLKLAGIKANRIPKHTTINTILTESHAVAQIQLADCLPDAKCTTLHSDGTNKFGHKFTGFQVNTEKGAYTIGIREAPSGTSQMQLHAFQQIIDDISDIAMGTEAEQNCGQHQKYHV